MRVAHHPLLFDRTVGTLFDPGFGFLISVMVEQLREFTTR